MDDEETNNSPPRRSLSIGRASSASSSTKRRSSSISYIFPHQVDYDSESESVSEAGDIGDRALHGNRNSGSSSFHLSFDSVRERNVVLPILDDTSSQPNRGIHNSVDPAAQSVSKKEEEFVWIINYLSCLAFLALFGILGCLFLSSTLSCFWVISRYYLQKLFGPEVVGATSERSYMYLDLPSNMVGSFLMGWLGVVFKGDISKVSENLAIGLTTGFLGSLTTFSGWNQKMLDLSVEGRWVFAILGIVIGLLLASSSIVVGIETAEGLKWLKKRSKTNLELRYTWKLEKHKSNLIITVVLLLMLGIIWGVCITFEKKEFKDASSNAQLLLACIVGPFGVWTRWYLARLNGRGLGERELLKWIPFGTLAANVLAACIMAALAVLKKAVKTNTCNTVATAIQFGFLGCLSTVSTFIAEFDAMRRSKYPWRAYAYAFSTILISFVLGTLIYSLPVWVKNFD